jgi:predicted esterase YcpF (UPF0227 family)
MTKKTVIYLHGVGAKPGSPSKKGKDLQAALEGEATVLMPTLPLDPDLIEDFIGELIRTLCINDHQESCALPDVKLMFVGVSIGGFWARYLGEMYDIPYVIANPIIDVEFLRQFIGFKWSSSYEDEFTQEMFVKYQRLDKVETSGYLANIFLAQDDPVIPYQKTLEEFKWARTQAIFPDGGHDFDLHWDDLIKVVKILISK